MNTFQWENFLAVTKNHPPWPLLIKAVSYVTHKGHALDLGSGAGRDTKYLLAQGFHVTAVDSSPHAIALLAQLPQHNLRLVQSTFQDFAYETYDLINAQFALPFNPKESFHVVFARVKQSLNPGGIFVGQLFGIYDQWNTPNSSMTFLTREQVKALFTDLNMLEFRELEEDGQIYDGTPKHWHVFHIIAQKGLE